jgi:hypothetical protein
MFTLKDLAEAGYIMGLATIGEVANHVELHYDAYWKIDEMKARSAELNELIAGRAEDSIFKYLTDDDKRQMDDELEKAMEEGPHDEAKGEEEGEQENKHF